MYEQDYLKIERQTDSLANQIYILIYQVSEPAGEEDVFLSLIKKVFRKY
jgi:hypothetical protein